MVLKTSAFVKSYDRQTKWTCFLIENDDFENSMAGLIKLQIFLIKNIPKVDSSYTCSAVINLHSPLKKDDNYYPQVILKEPKYIEKKVITPINDILSDCFSSHEFNDSDQE